MTQQQNAGYAYERKKKIDKLKREKTNLNYTNVYLAANVID